MAFNITDIKSAINKVGGIHRPAHFFVRITPPGFIASQAYNRSLEFFCESTTLPGLHLDTTPIRPMGYGNPESRPTDTTFQPITLDFFVDNSNLMLNYFQTWMGNINNFGRDIRKASDGTALNYYEFAYPTEYEARAIDIYLCKPSGYTKEGDEVVKYTLEHAFPITIGDMTMAWEINDTISRLPITFAYNVWHNKNLPFNAAAREIGEKVNLLRSNLPAVVPNDPVASTLTPLNTAPTPGSALPGNPGI